MWLVGVDGASWDVIRPLLAAGEMPRLAALMERGAHGVLRSEEPTISPALWATIATGMPRFEHGIVDFSVRVPGGGLARSGPADRRAPALWELVGAAGGRSAVVGWFGSYPAEPIRGAYVSKGFDNEKPDPREVHPPELLDALVEKMRVDARRGDVEAIVRTPFLQDTLVEDLRTMAALRVVLEEGSYDLVATYLSGIDVVQHVTWRHMDPDSQAFPQDGPPDPALADVIPSYYRFVDHALGGLVDAAPENATFVIVSDHGAGPLEPAEAYHFQLDVLLAALGLDDRALAFGELYRHDERVWLNLAGVEPDGIVSPGDAAAVAGEIAGRLRALRTDDDEPVFALVDVTADDDGWQPGDAALRVRFSAAALLAESVDDGGTRIEFAPVRLRHEDVSGAHRRDGIVVVAGPAVRPGALPEPVSLYRVAPTVLYLLGLPQDRRMLRWAPADGGVLAAAVADETLADRPVTMVAGYPGTDRDDARRELAGRRDDREDPRAEEQLERLRSLGYVR